MHNKNILFIYILQLLIIFSLFIAENASGIETDERGFILKQEEPLVPAPAVLGLTLDKSPGDINKILKKNGYNMKDPMLFPPYTVTKYNKKTDIFPDIELRICNHPSTVVKIIFSGPIGDTLYDLVRERFSLKVGNVVKSDSLVYYETYRKEFTDDIIVRLYRDGGETKLVIESEKLAKKCSESQEDVTDVFKRLDEIDRKKRENEQRSNF